MVAWPGLERQLADAAEIVDSAIADGVSQGGDITVYGYLIPRPMQLPEPPGRLGPLKGRVELVLPSAPETVRRARRLVQMIAAKLHLAESERYDYAVATGEALTNAMKHGSPGGRRDAVGLRVSLYEHGLATQVRDGGAWAGDAARREAPAVDGRGLQIMKALVDDVCVEAVQDGTVVTLAKRENGKPRA